MQIRVTRCRRRNSGRGQVRSAWDHRVRSCNEGSSRSGRDKTDLLDESLKIHFVAIGVGYERNNKELGGCNLHGYLYVGGLDCTQTSAFGVDFRHAGCTADRLPNPVSSPFTLTIVSEVAMKRNLSCYRKI